MASPEALKPETKQVAPLTEGFVLFIETNKVEQATTVITVRASNREVANRRHRETGSDVWAVPFVYAAFG